MPRGAREAAIRIGIDSRYLRASTGAADRHLKKWGGRIGADLGRTMRGAFGGFGGIAGLLGIGALTAEAQKVIQFEKRITQLGVASRSSAASMARLKKQIFEIAQSRGLDPDQLLGGVEKFVALTGDIDAAAKALDAFGQVAAATGSNVEDITVAAAALANNMGISGEAMKDAFGGLAAQGKAGAVELRDMAGILAGLTPQFATFNKTGVEGMRELGAMLQLAQQGFKGAAETATGLTSLMTKLVKNAKQLKKIGVNVFETGPNGERRLRNMADIVFEIGEKTGGDPGKLMTAIGDIEAYKALLPILKAGRGEFEKLVNAAKGGAAELDADFARIAETPAFKIEQAKTQLKRIFNEQLVRVLPHIASAMEKIADAIEWIAKHGPEAAAVFLALKGGSMLGGLAGGMGSGGRSGGRAGALIGAGGSMLQGAGVGFAMSRLGPRLGGAMDDVSAAGLTAAGALAMLPGPIGLIAKAALGLEGAVQLAIAGIEKKERQMLGRTLDSFFLDRAAEVGIGANGVDMGPRVAGKVTDRQRSGAKSIMAEAVNQGFVTVGNDGGLSMDEGAMSKFVDSQKGWDEETRNRAKAAFRRSFWVAQNDQGVGAATGNAAWGNRAPIVFGQDTGGAGGGLTADQAMAAGQGTARVLIQLGLSPGFMAEVISNDPSIRTSGGGR